MLQLPSLAPQSSFQSALVPRYCQLRAAFHTPGKPWSRLTVLQGRFHGCEAGPKSPMLRPSTRRCTSSPRSCAASQLVKNAIFTVVELAKPALIPRCNWLQAALHTPEEPRSRIALFQGRYHGREARPKSAIFHDSTRRHPARARAAGRGAHLMVESIPRKHALASRMQRAPGLMLVGILAAPSFDFGGREE